MLGMLSHTWGRAVAPSRLAIAVGLALSIALCACAKKPAPTVATKPERITTPPIQITETKTLNTTAAPAPAAAGPMAPPATTPPPPSSVPGVTLAPSSVAYTPTAIKAVTNIEVLVDGSGSMNAILMSGSKLELLKKTLKDLATQSFPAETRHFLGLRVYGAGAPLNDKKCDDSALLQAIKPIDASSWGAAVDKLTAQGMAPLTYAMEQAGEDFPTASADADNLLIVVADGTDSCQMDPCSAALKLHQSAKKIIIHVVGFDLDQTAQSALTCISKSADGQFYLARNEYELRNALDQAMNANYPYNLRLKVMAGATPIPATLTVYQGGTQKIIQRDKATGIKFYKLPAGNYDIAVEYTDSPEITKPTKLLKGVDLQATTRAEQIVQFNLGNLTLAASDQAGTAAVAVYQIKKAGTDQITAKFTAGPDPQTIALTPGTYDISAEMTDANGLRLTAVATNQDVKEGMTTDETFKFQTGQFFVRMQHPEKGFLGGQYRATRPDQPTEVVAAGEVSPDGTAIELPPGNYDFYLDVTDSDLTGLAGIKLSNTAVAGGEMHQQLVTLTSGGIKLSGKDGQGKPVKTEFSIRQTGEVLELTKATMEDKDTERMVYLPPGKYDITATNIGANINPAPSILWTGVEVKEGQTTTQEGIFQLGEIKLLGRNVKEQRIVTQFTAYRAGSDEPLGAAMADTGWATFYLTPGFYDFKGEDVNATTDPKPTAWFHDVEITVGPVISKEAVFSSGKLKVICRGENNSILPCNFSVFTYRSDRPLYSGQTTDNWRDYDIPPGKYYMETGYNDPDAGVLLKKWINFSVDENQIVEQVLRF